MRAPPSRSPRTEAGNKRRSPYIRKPASPAEPTKAHLHRAGRARSALGRPRHRRGARLDRHPRRRAPLPPHIPVRVVGRHRSRLPERVAPEHGCDADRVRRVGSQALAADPGGRTRRDHRRQHPVLALEDGWSQALGGQAGESKAKSQDQHRIPAARHKRSSPAGSCPGCGS